MKRLCALHGALRNGLRGGYGIQFRRAAARLYIETIWRTRSKQADTFTSAAVSHWEMVISRYQGKTTLTVLGPETKATSAAGPADAEFVGIKFKLGSFTPHLPVSRLVDGLTVLPKASRRAVWLQGSAVYLPDFDDADVFTERLVRDGLLVRDPVVDAVLQGEPHRFSPRTAQRRFLTATGLTYSAVQQINGLDSRRHLPSWLRRPAAPHEVPQAADRTDARADRARRQDDVAVVFVQDTPPSAALGC